MHVDQIANRWWPWSWHEPRIGQLSIDERTSDFAQRLAYFGLVLLSLVPLSMTLLPPCVDLPNHLARIHILASIDNDVWLQQNYSANWSLRTYFLPDYLLVGLAKLLPIYWVGKIYVGAALVGLASGAYFLATCISGKPSVWCFGVVLVLFSHPLSWGFINYLLGVSLALVTFGVWIRDPLRLDWRGQCLSVALLAILTLATYLTHIFATAMLGVLLATYLAQGWISRKIRLRDFGVRCCHLGIAFAVPLYLSLLRDVNETVRTGPTIYGDALDKLRATFSPTMFDGHWLERWTLLAGGALIAFLIQRKFVAIDRRMIGPLVVLTMLAIAMPLKLTGVFGLDFRLPVVCCLILLASLQEVRTPASLKRTVLAVGLACFVARIGLLAADWQNWDKQLDELRGGMQTIAPGTRLLTVGRVPARYGHLNALAAIDQSAFVPTLFTGATLLRPSQETAVIDTPSGMPLAREQLGQPTANQIDGYHTFYWGEWQRDFDYLLSLDPPSDQQRSGLIHRGSFFSIYEISKLDASTKRLDTP